jgi:hypothetical protein
MLAMQYSFTLPADYDMAIIRQRIATKGHLFNNFPHLAFKTFLYACRSGGSAKSRQNLYAPFYLWHDPAGLNAFLCGSGFAALKQAFGRPAVTIWSVWHAELASVFDTATVATREIVPIVSEEELDRLQESETAQAIADVRTNGALAAVAAFEPGSWTLVRFRLWDGYRQALERRNLQAYDIGHIAVSP